jgi:hypothetical protein
MPNPVQASIDPAVCTLSGDVSGEEYDAQMSLPSAHPVAGTAPGVAAGASTAPTPAPAPTPTASPAVSALVSRFTAPVGVHAPVEPSLGEALLNCKAATLSYAASLVGAAAAAPETGGMSVAALGVRILASGAALLGCIDQNKAQQVQEGNRANQAADCRAEGATPLTTADGVVVCAK